ncbi:hypothetical protein [Asticcacaulis sp. AC466]|nr:hypothetical protein [Asticcacaulis sp. AC466]
MKPPVGQLEGAVLRDQAAILRGSSGLFVYVPSRQAHATASTPPPCLA